MATRLMHDFLGGVTKYTGEYWIELLLLCVFMSLILAIGIYIF